MFEAIRKAIVAVTARHEAIEGAGDVRRLQAMAAKSLRRDTMGRDVAGIEEAASAFEALTGSWLDAEAIAGGASGPFDACDLGSWLVLAAEAGVPAVPARLILSLDERDAGIATGTVEVPESPMTRGLAALAARVGFGGGARGDDEGVDEAVTEAEREAVTERLFAAMDDVPEGWMVRSGRCGSSNLKGLAGCGIAGPRVPEVRFGPELEVGPGWVRRGNRRMVDVTDRRTVTTHAQAPHGQPLRLLARPWVTAARWARCEDPHRHGSPLAGEGLFPAEWRAFVEDGRISGIGSYYAWCGSPTPRNARVALAVRALAERIVAKVVERRLVPLDTDVEFTFEMARRRLEAGDAAFAGVEDAALRADPDLAWRHAALERDREAIADARRRFPADGVSMTLDFMEAMGGPGEHGLVLLEGGPPHHPLGGGHPCAFAGAAGAPLRGSRTWTEGVAFKVMDHVLVGEVSTWRDGDRSGRILDWEAVEALAAVEGDPDRVPDGVRPPATASDYRPLAAIAAELRAEAVARDAARGEAG